MYIDYERFAKITPYLDIARRTIPYKLANTFSLSLL